MWSAGSRPSSLRRLLGVLGVAILLVTLPCSAWAADPAVEQPVDAKTTERIDLFIALLRRRARQILEARRPPPPPLITYSASLFEGYESNVNLDGERRGDFFTQETFGVRVRPRVTPWLRGEFKYDLLNTHYAELRDTNLWINTLESTVQWQPHDRVRVDVGYEYSIVNFPFNTSSSYFDQRTGVHVLLAQTDWLTHKSGWVYQLRDYDTRKARNPDGAQITGVNREDQRHRVSHELRFRFPNTSARIAGEFYRNFSNELFRDFYDWEDYRVRGVLSRVLSAKWIGILIASHERRNYQKRRVPVIAVAERDGLTTLAGSLIHEINPNAQLTYSVTYRYQDSNDPRLDFTDWVNQLGMTVRF